MKSLRQTIVIALGALVAALLLPAPGTAATCDQFNCVTMHDTIPNFAGQPTIRSLKTGSWSSASTWNLGRVPNATDIVAITGGTTITIDGTSSVAGVIGIEALGTLTFRTDVTTRLTVGTLLVQPQGTLQVGTAATPISAVVSAEIVIADQPLDLTNDGIGVFDPRQFGTGLVSVDGKVSMAGAAKTTFVRLATEPKTGDTSLALQTPVTGWAAGDRIFLPDSKPVSSAASSYVFEGEELSVSSVSPDGRTVFLASALKYNHPGARDGNDVLEFLPHVGNVGRNVLVRSANPAGTRGHMFFTERSDIDLRYVAVRNMGRTTVDPLDNTTFDTAGNVVQLGTNQIGRYPMHLHHVLGPIATPANGRQFTLVGNAIDDDAAINRHKWAITIHASHYGLISGNVIYNAGGYGIGTEDGSESFNEFSSNFIAKVRGEGGRELAEAGDGLWFRGPNNYVRDNVIANVRGSQIEGSHGVQFFFKYLGNICVPNFKGADMTQCTTYNGNTMPLLEFARNEVYGATETGLAIWWLGTNDFNPLAITTSTVQDFRVWNFTLYGYYGYPANKLTFDGFVARGRKAFLSNVNEFVTGFWVSDYMNQDLTIRRADIQNLRLGIIPPYFSRGTTLIEDSYLRNAVNIQVRTIGAPGSQPYGPNMPAKQTTIKNVTFAAVNASVGGWGPTDIDMTYTLWNGSANLVKRDGVYVYGFNKVAGDDFQVFYKEQDPNFIVPQSSGNLAGSPAAGLTNTQNWSTYGIAIAGEMATNVTTRTGINGFVRPGTPPSLPVAPTITTQPASVTVAAGATATFSVTASGSGTLTYQWQKNNVNITGATGPTYTTPATVAADSGSTFRCIVQNSSGAATSGSATLTVTGGTTTSAPSITKQPSSVTVTVGASATFSVTASGSGTLTYQWQKNNVNIAGATATSYTTPATVSGDGGSTFRCIVTNSAGSVASASATLTVTSATVTSSTSEASTTNKPPVVYAGADKTVTFKKPSVTTTLTGSVTDDGLPSGKLSLSWKLTSGPASVTFGAPASSSTTVKFTKPGDYTLTLTASDGALSASDSVLVHVLR